MAVITGTNAGFVTVAPTSDPGGSEANADNRSLCVQDTTSADIQTVTEVGWYCSNATEEANFEVGIYDSDAGDAPNNLLFSDTTNAKGTDAGWKTSAVNWDLSGYQSADLYVAYQCDDTATTSKIDYSSEGGTNYDSDIGTTSLENPWGGGAESTGFAFAIYALYNTGGTEHTQTTTDTLTMGSDFFGASNIIKDFSLTASFDEITLLSIQRILATSITLSFSIESFANVITRTETLTIGESPFVTFTTTKDFSLTTSFEETVALVIVAIKSFALSIAESIASFTIGKVTPETLTISFSPFKAISFFLANSLTVGTNWFNAFSTTKSEDISFTETLTKTINIIKDEGLTLTFDEITSLTRILNLAFSLSFEMIFSKLSGITLSFELDIGFVFWRTTNLGNKLVNDFNKILGDDIRDTFETVDW